MPVEPSLAYNQGGSGGGGGGSGMGSSSKDQGKLRKTFIVVLLFEWGALRARSYCAPTPGERAVQKFPLR
jgi:hypothetical protein